MADNEKLNAAVLGALKELAETGSLLAVERDDLMDALREHPLVKPLICDLRLPQAKEGILAALESHIFHKRITVKQPLTIVVNV